MGLTTIVLLCLAALADPTIRYPFLGVQLERELEQLEGSDPMTVLLSVESGSELISEDLLSEEPAVQDEYSVFFILREELRKQKESASAHYTVEKMESEQWAWKEAELDKLEARAQVYPKQICSSPQIQREKTSVMSSDGVWTPLLTFFWPKLPDGFQKAGQKTWQDRVTYRSTNPVTKEEMNVNINLVYRLDKFVNTEHGVLANVFVLGGLTEGSETKENVDVKGSLEGFVLIETDTGRAYGGEYRIEEHSLVRQANLPVVRRATYQGAKFWRPMFYKMSAAKPSTESNPSNGDRSETPPGTN